MATDNYKEVFWNDGEGLTHGDLNDAERFLLAKIYDQILTQPIGSLLAQSGGSDLEFGAQNSTEVATTHAYCLSPGRAYLRKGTAVNKIQIAPGTLLQKVGTSDGSEPKFLAFTFLGTEEVTISNGDATNPRCDLIQMKLEVVESDSQTRDFKDATTGVITSTTMNKKRRVQCTLSVKAGTPAATPTVPDPDSGYVGVAFVQVNATYTSGGAASYGVEYLESNSTTTLCIHDLRMPVSVKAYQTRASQFLHGANWTYDPATGYISATGAPGELFVPYTGPLARVIGLELNASWIGSPKVRFSWGWPSGRSMCELPMGSLSTWRDIAQNHGYTGWPGSFGPLINESAADVLGPPVWTNGARGAYPRFQRMNEIGFGTSNPMDFGLLVPTSTFGDQWHSVTFIVAEGL